MASLWIDVISPSEALFFNSLTRDLDGYDVTLTAAESAETTSLLELKGAKFRKFGSHPTSKGIARQFGVLSRSLECIVGAPRFDVSLSFDNFYAILTSVARRRPTISIDDNDKIEKMNLQFSLKNSSFVIIPEAFPKSKLTKLGMREEQLLEFPGYKEDIYLADFSPDLLFPEKVPFQRYVVLRPEALFASYVHENRSIVRDLSASLVKNGFKVVFLPRNEHERGLVKPSDYVFVPEKALNGLDLCWHADAVLTGSGTLAREAALLGVTAVSFFPGTMLAVDQDLVSRDKMYHSRDPESIVRHLLNHEQTRQTLSSVKERSSTVRRVLLGRLKWAIESCLEGGDG